MRVRTVILTLAVSLLIAAPALLAQTTDTPVKVNPPAAVRQHAATPPAGVKTGTSIGKGKVAAHTANSPTDSDSMWAEKLDIDGDGNVDDVQVLWDDEDKVFYYYKEGTFTCKNGGTGSGGMLVAVYAAGNTHGKPANSGWWVTEVDKGECGAQAAGVIGCKFDAAGAATSCGVAIVDDKTDDIMIAVAHK